MQRRARGGGVCSLTVSLHLYGCVWRAGGLAAWLRAAEHNIVYDGRPFMERADRRGVSSNLPRTTSAGHARITRPLPPPFQSSFARLIAWKGGGGGGGRLLGRLLT